MITSIISDKRPLIEVTLNGKPGVLLVDTGASINSLDKSVLKSNYNVSEGMLYGEVAGAGGTQETHYASNCDVVIGNTFHIKDWILMDLTAVKQSIKAQAKQNIIGILGTPSIKKHEMKIDLNKNIITFGEVNNFSE